jgi:hypothetical protein
MKRLSIACPTPDANMLLYGCEVSASGWGSLRCHWCGWHGQMVLASVPLPVIVGKWQWHTTYLMLMSVAFFEMRIVER